eukprot:4574603-Alexandrium_andersonii.AAC.1
MHLSPPRSRTSGRRGASSTPSGAPPTSPRSGARRSLYLVPPARNQGQSFGASPAHSRVQLSICIVCLVSACGRIKARAPGASSTHLTWHDSFQLQLCLHLWAF